MLTPEDVAKYPLHISPEDFEKRVDPKDGTGHLSLSNDYHISFGPGYRETITSVYSSGYPIDSRQPDLVNSLKGSIYQKIESLKDEEVASQLREFYKQIEKRGDEKVLEDLINLDRNIELYIKLDELDYKINEKEKKAYRDLRWFERKGIKLDEGVKEEIFDAYIYGDENLRKEMERVANVLGTSVENVPYAYYVMRELLASNPTVRMDEIKEEVNYESAREGTAKGKRSKAKAIAAAALMIGAGIVGAGAYKVYKDGERVMGDGSYFFHHFDQYKQYLNAEDKNDVDGDGYPNWFESKYGLDPFDPTDVTKDSDGDGYADWFEEKFTKTNPHSPNERYLLIVNGMYDWPGGSYKEDTQDTIDIFTSKFKVPEENIIALIPTKNATYENFINALNEIKSKVDNDDIFVCCILLHGGHNGVCFFREGMNVDDYLTGSCGKGLTHEEFFNHFKDIKTGRMLLIFDSCFIGNGFDELKRTKFETPATVILATSEDEESYGFSAYFFTYMDEKRGDLDGNGFVSPYEAFKMYYKYVTEVEKLGYHPKLYDPQNLANSTYLGQWSVFE